MSAPPANLFGGIDADMALLVENQWWSGFTFCDPAMTRRLLDGIAYDNVGIMLNIDRHEPWTDPAVADLVRHIGPEWVTNELSAGSRAARNERLRVQLDALSGLFA